MQRIAGALREHILDPRQTCSAVDGDGVGVVGRGRAPGRGEVGGLCWKEPFMVDIRYDTSTDQVCVCVSVFVYYMADIRRCCSSLRSTSTLCWSRVFL